MKKQILVMMAVCLLVLPTFASTLTEQLCSDESFVAMVEEVDQMTQQLKSMDERELKQFILSEEFSCFRENIAQNQAYLTATYQLTENTNREAVVKAIEAIRKVATKRCDEVYAMMWTSCLGISDPYYMSLCFINAQQWYDQCTGGAS